MPFSRSAILVIVATPVLSVCSDSTGPAAGPPALMEIVSGNQQQDTVGRELPEPLVVRVVDSANRPVRLQIINFRVTAGGGSVFAGSGLTDTLGEARERWTLGTVAADSQRVEARAVDTQTGEALLFATFQAVAVAGRPAALTKEAGDQQTGLPGIALQDSLSVLVEDQYGNPVPGQTATWNVLGGGGTITPTSTTNSQGVARAGWAIGSGTDTTYLAGVTVAGLAPATFTATRAVLTLAGGGRGFEWQIGDAETLTVWLHDQASHNWPGIPVTRTAATGTITPLDAVTNLYGNASAVWNLGTRVDTEVVATAAVAGVAPATFVPYWTVPQPVVFTKDSGDAQTAPAGTTLPESLVVKLTLSDGRPIQGAIIDWWALPTDFTGPGHGVVAPAVTRTGLDGRSRASWTTDTIPGAKLAYADATRGVLASTILRVQFTATATGTGGSSRR